MPLINEEEFQRPNDVFRPSPFREAGDGHGAFDPNMTGVAYAHSEIDTPEPQGFIMEGAVGSEQIADGAVTPRTVDATAPAVPTNLALSSQPVSDSDGRTALVLLIDVTQPPDTDLDLYGVYVDLTDAETVPGTPDWNYSRSIFIPANASRALVAGVVGNRLYYVRARSADTQGNLSAYTAVVSHTSGKDAEAPPIPDGLVVNAAFRGFFANWNLSIAADLMFSQVRYAMDDGTGTGAGINPFTTINVRTSGIFVGNLVADQMYWVQVRAVDFSGNVVTSDIDPTPVDYLTNPEAGWTTAVAVTPTLVGATDVAFNSVMANIIASNSIDADAITAGTLRISPDLAYANGIEILAADLTIIGRWNEFGLKIVDPLDTSRYLLLASGEVRFTTDDGATFPLAITPEGINASAINFGSMPGGHNLVLNSSFELSGFAVAASTNVFTDATKWAAANRITAPANTSEGTSLTMTTPGWV